MTVNEKPAPVSEDQGGRRTGGETLEGYPSDGSPVKVLKRGARDAVAFANAAMTGEKVYVRFGDGAEGEFSSHALRKMYDAAQVGEGQR